MGWDGKTSFPHLFHLVITLHLARLAFSQTIAFLSSALIHHRHGQIVLLSTPGPQQQLSVWPWFLPMWHESVRAQWHPGDGALVLGGRCVA